MIINYDNPLWKSKSEEIKKRDFYRCQICGQKESLNVHHILYLKNKELWDYPSNYLITLCPGCHTLEHFYLRQIGFIYNELLLSGMLACDVYKKLKSNEKLYI